VQQVTLKCEVRTADLVAKALREVCEVETPYSCSSSLKSNFASLMIIFLNLRPKFLNPPITCEATRDFLYIA